MVAGYTTDKKSGRRIIARMPECQENVYKGNVTMPVDTRATSLDESKDVRSQEGKIILLYGSYIQVYVVSKNLEG